MCNKTDVTTTRRESTWATMSLISTGAQFCTNALMENQFKASNSLKQQTVSSRRNCQTTFKAC